MWDQRYASDAFVYGTEPNAFLAQHANLLTGPVLSLAEGEGRNAVFLATLGLEVHGVDGSAVGLAKAMALAASKGVTIRTEVADLAVFDPPPSTYGSVISISAHLPSAIRKRLHQRVERALRPGGIMLLEAYTKEQLTRNTGGPRDADMLMSRAELEREFPNCEPILAREIEREVVEGTFHTGLACVVQFIARKKG